MSRLRLGLVGAGRIGHAYSEVIRGCDEIELAGVADADLLAAKEVAASHAVDAFISATALLDAVEPDAVLVCTPPNTHFEISMELIDRGTHLMCEKPLALSTAEAGKMLSAAEANSVILTMASKFRYVEDVIRAHSILRSGVLGEVILLENTFASPVDMSQRWNSDVEVAGGGVLIDNGTHSVDLVRFFLGPITEVMAVEGRRAQALDVEDTAQLFLRNAGGARATVDLSWSIDKARDWYLEIYGSEGTIQVGWRSSRYKQRTSSDWVTLGTGYHRDQAINDQLANFARSITDGEPLRITARDALASVEVMEAAYRSLPRDWVRVESSTFVATGK